MNSEGEKQGQYEYHDDTHNDLQRQTDFDVIHESYWPAGMTNALGGVENGDAKHMLAPRVTANRKGTGLTPICSALCKAMGASNTAVAVLLMNMVIREVVK